MNIRKHKIWIILGILLVFMVVMITIVIILFPHKSNLKNEITVELGDAIALKDFYKEEDVPTGATFVTDISTLNKVGDYEVIIQERKEEKVTVHVVDTTSPKVEFQDVYASLNYEINPEDFIVAKEDLSTMKVYLEETPDIKEYKTYSVTVIVEDEFKNQTKQQCNLHISIFKSFLKAELGTKITKEDFVLDSNHPVQVNQKELDAINKNGVGEYHIKISVDGKEYDGTIVIEDTTKPHLVLQDITIRQEEDLPKKEDFIKEVSDASKEVTTKMVSTLNKSNEKQKVVIEAVDSSGNQTTQTSYLYIEKDKEPPTLTLKSITIYQGSALPKKEDFIVEARDQSGIVTTTLLTPIRDDLETQEIRIQAEDKYHNRVEKKTTFKIVRDKEAPTFSGLTNITVQKNAKIDYNKGVKAYDNKDGNVSFTVDSSKVNLKQQGTYYATYSATDKAGNKRSIKRKIVVEHDDEDLQNLLKQYASSIGDNYEDIRQFVLTNIHYTENWGGDDPVWYGLTTMTGNCYVHALVYQKLLEMKGYKVMLIWATNKSHYWNLIYLDGIGWRHSDSTPGNYHGMVSAETDEERYAHLQGRDWDRSLWPEAN